MESNQNENRARILIIDDNEAIHRDFRKIFDAKQQDDAGPSELEHELFGRSPNANSSPSNNAIQFELKSAYQGEEGLMLVKQAVAEKQPFAMAFVDVRMQPGLDGIETTAQIWQHDPEIQVVICTAYSDYSWSEIQNKLGYSDRLLILRKPFDVVEVLQLTNGLAQKWLLLQRLAEVAEGAQTPSLSKAELAQRYERLLGISHFLSAVNSINTLLLRSRKRDVLFQHACEVFVDKANVDLACIRVVTSDHSFTAVASNAANEVYLATAQLPLDMNANGQEPMVKQLREKQAYLCDDLGAEVPRAPSQDAALNSGLQSLLAAPLVVQGKVVGCVELYCADKQLFHAEESASLAELADNIAYAMEYRLDKQAT